MTVDQDGVDDNKGDEDDAEEDDSNYTPDNDAIMVEEGDEILR